MDPVPETLTVDSVPPVVVGKQPGAATPSSGAVVWAARHRQSIARGLPRALAGSSTLPPSRQVACCRW